MRASLLTAALLLSGCSFVTAGFTECETSADCGDGRTCAAGYCVEPGCHDVHGAKDDPNAIALGAALPITVTGGGQDQSEVQSLNALTLAVEEINQRQGVGGRPFALYVCDTAGSADRLKEQLTYLADTKSVAAVVTSGSGQTVAASSVAIPKGVLLMSATATSPELTALNDKPSASDAGLVWRTAPSDAIQGQVMAELLTSSGGTNPGYGLNTAAKIALVYDDDVYGQGLAGVLRLRLDTAGKSTSEHLYKRGAAAATLQALVDALDSEDPDVTVVIGFPDDLTRLLALAIQKPSLKKAAGHKWLFSDAAKDPALLTDPAVKAELEGALGTAPAQGAGSAYASFKSRFQSRFATNPDNFSFVSHSYDAMYLLALGAAHAAGSGELTGARIANGLTRLSSGTQYALQPDRFTPAAAALQAGGSIDVQGASGELDFDGATGDAPSPIEIWRIKVVGTSSFETAEQRTPAP